MNSRAQKLRARAFVSALVLVAAGMLAGGVQARTQSIPRVGNGVFGPAVATPSGPVVIGATADGRSPDAAEAATQAQTRIVTLTKSSRFAWREFGIGAAAAAGALLLLLGAGAVLLAGRGRGEVARPTASA